jgi:spermidine/putrescine transport system permease protein
LIGTSLLVAASDQGIRLGVGVTALAHTLLVAPIVILVVYARLSAMDPSLVEAARDLGASPMKALRTITFPLILPSIVGAALLAAAYSIDEILVTTFTIGTDFTVPVWLLGQARIGFSPGINALGVMLMGGTLLMFGLAAFALRRALFGAVAR